MRAANSPPPNIGGGIILNVLKEELPGERRARFIPFAAGATLYTALLQLA